MHTMEWESPSWDTRGWSPSNRNLSVKDPRRELNAALRLTDCAPSGWVPLVCFRAELVRNSNCMFARVRISTPPAL